MTTRRTLANAIRFLALDAVEIAQSGHPGIPMGMADIAEVLWNDFLLHNPLNPQWFNRDRFVLSNGHGCMLQYALLHLTGYPLAIEDIKQFRQLHSKTPGHPEYGDTPGVETTTGPLGQGLANGVGFALAEKILAARFNKKDLKLIDHYTYVFAGDGCMMEGVSHEACSLAGTLKLGKLIVFYDDNGISIDGDVAGWFTENIPLRFEAYGWHVIPKVDGHDPKAIQNAIKEARSNTDRPSIICCQTIIGYGSPHRQGKNKAHSDAMGKEEIALTREQLNWPYAPFEIPQEIYHAYNAKEKGAKREKDWQFLLKQYTEKYPKEGQAFIDFIEKKALASIDPIIEALVANHQNKKDELATRKASQKCINQFAAQIPQLLGGSADLTGSNGVLHDHAKVITGKDASGDFIHYGVREFAMFAIMNGLALHSGFIPFGGTFLTFIDYGRNAMRLAAMMHQQIIYVLTHDSIGLGEDGPTHQPIEHISILRATPQISVWRPADMMETIFSWRQALQNQHQPTALLLTRQNVLALEHTPDTIAAIKRGAYIIFEPKQKPKAIIIATGSEVALAITAAKKLEAEKISVRVVSMPSHDEFQKQDKAYQEKVLPPLLKHRVAVEAGASHFWYQYVGEYGTIIGIDKYGASAKAEAIFIDYGFTVENIIKHVKNFFLTENTGVTV